MHFPSLGPAEDFFIFGFPNAEISENFKTLQLRPVGRFLARSAPEDTTQHNGRGVNPPGRLQFFLGGILSRRVISC